MKPKHISPVDWYLVSAWLKFDCTEKQNHAYQDIWENTYLVKANSIKDVLPVYETLQDGAELFWSDLGRRENSEIDRAILSKEDYLERLKE